MYVIQVTTREGGRILRIGVPFKDLKVYIFDVGLAACSEFFLGGAKAPLAPSLQVTTAKKTSNRILKVFLMFLHIML